MPTNRQRHAPAGRRSRGRQPAGAAGNDGPHEAIRETARAEDLGLERIVFLSDGVFAIAMTLLVLEVRLPDLAATATNDELVTAVLGLGGRLFAYVLSFAVLATFWIAHWRRFRKFERSDGRLAWINLLLLGLVAFVPFPTAVIGEFGNLPAAVILYAVTLSLAGLASTLTWFYAARAGLLLPGTPTGLRASGTLRALTVPLVMLGSLLLLPIAGVYVVEWSWLLILPLMIVSRPPRGRTGG